MEEQGNTALLGAARTWASPPTPLHAGLTPNHALGLPYVSAGRLLSPEVLQKGTGTAAGQQRKAFPIFNLRVLVLGGSELMSEKSMGRFAKGLLLR